ncbi:transporter substrate-binding domain-containing protein [Paenibacillus sp. DMB20]|uniref:transporter substrate-binding domain-containing protein n=1 Tax=Paenibacillus sp. DMB20 TaxID=1642570 RepID=UPI000628083C|nr:transporter substrate-binding domain-containing protein [Paenibacillus sp. DMB20]KKO51223.1 ABC transporter substrate-binding protein [Paenibacillus sp. DMB20]
MFGISTVCKLLLTAALALGFLSGCGNNQARDRVPTPNMGVAPYRVDTGRLLQDASLRGTLRIGTEGNYPPFSYRGADGSLKGFDVELAEEVARHMEMKAVFVEKQWKDLLPGLTGGAYDAVFNQVADTAKRRGLYDFSDAYMSATPVLVVRPDERDIRSFRDIKGKNVAVEAVGEYRSIASRHRSNTIQARNYSDATDLLLRRTVDAVITDSLSVLNMKQTRPDLAVKTADSLDETYNVCAAVANGNPDLLAAVNNALRTMQQDGTYLAIWSKYFGDGAPSLGVNAL